MQPIPGIPIEMDRVVPAQVAPAQVAAQLTHTPAEAAVPPAQEAPQRPPATCSSSASDNSCDSVTGSGSTKVYVAPLFSMNLMLVLGGRALPLTSWMAPCGSVRHLDRKV